MSTTILNIIPRKLAEAAQSTQYTSTTARTLIDKFTATNTSAQNVKFSCNLVASGDTPATENLVLDDRTIPPGDTYLCPELVGQILEDGGTISTLAGAASAIVISASGRVITE